MNPLPDNIGSKYIEPLESIIDFKFKPDMLIPGKASLWVKDQNNNILPVVESITKLPEEVYSVHLGIHGVHFKREQLPETVDLPLEPNKKSDIINIIKDWEFQSTSTSIFLLGKTGLGKKHTIKSIKKLFIDTKLGVVLESCHPLLLTYALSYLKSIEPNTKVLIDLDDLNLYFSKYSKDSILKLITNSNNTLFTGHSSDVNFLPIDVIKNINVFPHIFYYKNLSLEDKEILLTNKFPKISDSNKKIILDKSTDLNINEFLDFAHHTLIYQKDTKEILARINYKNSEELPNLPSPEKKILKRIHLDEDGNIRAITEEKVDSIAEEFIK